MPETNAKEVVVAFIKALNKEDFDAAQSYVRNDMSFVGVMGSRNRPTHTLMICTR